MKTDETICNLCKHNAFKVIEEGEPLFKVLKCNNCGLVFVNPHPERNSLRRHYNKSYYSEWINQQKNRRIKMWNSRLEKIMRIKPNGKLLDVGCGEGLFLGLAQAKGWEISGTEISLYASQFASKILGEEIYCGQLHEAAFADDSFDVVTMWHVLEHVEDPKGYLTEVYRVIRPGGLLVIAVPNINNLFLRSLYRLIKWRKLKLFSAKDKEIHLYHFSPKTLYAYLEKAGFDCLRIAPDYGIVQFSKKVINWVSVIPFYIAGIKFFNAIEAMAIARK